MNELALDPAWIARAVGGIRTGGNPAGRVANVVIDSRAVAPGDLFVAIRGPRFDGHDFVADVVERGAAAVLVQHGRAAGIGNAASESASQGGAAVGNAVGGVAGSGGAAVIEVPDTLQALQDLAHAIRVAAGTKVVAITGSAGKTTTKEVMAAFLGTRFRVVKNKGNLNNHIGLPLSLIELRTRPDMAVMELGMNHAGEISTLVAIAEPDVRVWTNVGDAHIGFFASADAIADAKAEILEHARPDTLLVCNADDPRVMARVRGFVGRTVTFGEAAGASVQASAIADLGLDGMRARVTTSAGTRVMETPLLGRGNLSNVLAGTATAIELGIPLDDVVQAATTLQPADRRGAVRPLRDGVRLVDDSYNSSPAALRRSLEMVGHESRARRKVAVLGEMLELGSHAVALHRESGRRAAEAGLSLLFAIGGEPAQALADAATAAGMPASAVHWFARSDEAAPAIVAQLQPGDLVLVKGSRGIRTDVVADRIAAELG